MSNIWNDLIQQMKNKIQHYHPQRLSIPSLTPAAVMILICKKKETLFLLMTQRSKTLKHHNGEMSFPGGKFDSSQDEDLLQTAIRETSEEIGLDPANIEIWGTLDDLPTLTGYIIRPFIGYIKNQLTSRDFFVNSEEVDEIVQIPFQFFLDLPKFDEILFKSNSKEFHLLSIIYHDKKTKKEYKIWGASAHILVNFFNIALNQQKCSEIYHRPSLSEIYDAFNKI
ncbi:MAG: NUDIX hydrolase [Promethearchaeota archaeon]